VNCVCGSGAQAILSAALEIAAGDFDVAIAGGMENMDRAPYLMYGGRWVFRVPAGMLAGEGVVQPVRQHAVEDLGRPHAVAP
ncbi:hypothetical protein AB9E21_35120, partial [Rhizobium leguminosarum]